MSRDLSVFTPEVVDRVFERDFSSCAKCARVWDRDYHRGTPWGWDMQHRMARGSGGARNDPTVGDVSNAIIMCRGCHHDVEVKFRDEGFTLGFVISRLGIWQPWDVPIRHAAHGWCRLTKEGGIEECSQT